MRNRDTGTARCHDDPPGEVTVVMVSYRTGPVLAQAIDAVLAPDQTGVGELILVDNGNPPEVASALAHRGDADPRLRLISGHGNVGYARGCNLGAREARGRYLLLLNPDCCLGGGGGARPAGRSRHARRPLDARLPRAQPPMAPTSAAHGGRCSPRSARWWKRSGSTGFGRISSGSIVSADTRARFPRASRACLP